MAIPIGVQPLKMVGGLLGSTGTAIGHRPGLTRHLDLGFMVREGRMGGSSKLGDANKTGVVDK